MRCSQHVRPTELAGEIGTGAYREEDRRGGTTEPKGKVRPNDALGEHGSRDEKKEVVFSRSKLGSNLCKTFCQCEYKKSMAAHV